MVNTAARERLVENPAMAKKAACRPEMKKARLRCRRAKSAALGIELARLLEQLVDVVPVDQIVDEGLEILRPGIAVVDVVAVLPDVDAEDRRAAVDQRVLAIGCLADLQLAVLDGQPGPAGTELRGAGGDEVLAELVVAAE